MENCDVLGVKLLSGEIVIAYIPTEQDTPGVLLTSHPLSLEYTQTQGGPTLGMRPFVPFSKEETFALNIAHVQGTFQPVDEIVDNYRKIVTKMTTGLVVPEKKSIILG